MSETRKARGVAVEYVALPEITIDNVIAVARVDGVIVKAAFRVVVPIFKVDQISIKGVVALEFIDIPVNQTVVSKTSDS